MVISFIIINVELNKSLLLLIWINEIKIIDIILFEFSGLMSVTFQYK